MAEKIKIYGQRVSPYVERIYLQVKYKNLFDHIEFAGTPKGGFYGDDYLKISPWGKMPALVWGDFTLYESRVINEFLENTFPDKPMLPADPKEKAKVRLVIRILDLYYHPNTLALMGLVLQKDRDPEIVEKHVAPARKTMNVIEGMTTGEHKYLFGDDMTLADTSLFSSIFIALWFSKDFGVDYFDKRPKLRAWYDRLRKDPMFADSHETRASELMGFIEEMQKRAS